MQLKDSIKLTPFKCAVIRCLLTYLSLALIHLFSGFTTEFKHNILHSVLRDDPVPSAY